MGAEAIVILAAIIAAALLTWAICAIYWSGRYGLGLVDGRAEVLSRQLETSYDPDYTILMPAQRRPAISPVQAWAEGVDLDQWRAWADNPAAPIPRAEVIPYREPVALPDDINTKILDLATAVVAAVREGAIRQ